jgi:hypothetical protein
MGPTYVALGYLVVTVMSGLVVGRLTDAPEELASGDRVLGLLLLSVLGGWIFHVANITALGYSERRFALVAPTVGIAGAAAYALLVQAMPGRGRTRRCCTWWESARRWAPRPTSSSTPCGPSAARSTSQSPAGFGLSS